MPHRIKIVFGQPSRVKLSNRSVFRLRATASDAEGDNLDNAIFLHQRSLVSADEDTGCDEFVSICSAFDLVTYPTDDPDPEQSPQFFRKSTFDMLLPSVSVVDEVITSVKNQVAVLIDTLDAIDDIDSSETYWYPDSE